jgi:hypothetical protein
VAGPDGGPRMFLSPAWSGEPARGHKAINELLAKGLSRPATTKENQPCQFPR